MYNDLYVHDCFMCYIPYAPWGAPQSQLLKIFLITVIVELPRGVVEHLIFYSDI